jgi:hypothetical protein
MRIAASRIGFLSESLRSFNRIVYGTAVCLYNSTSTLCLQGLDARACKTVVATVAFALFVLSGNAQTKISESSENPSTSNFKSRTTTQPFESPATAAQHTAATTPASQHVPDVVDPLLDLDQNSLPADVRQRMDNNKAAGRNLFDGLLKGHRVQIKSCRTQSDVDKTFGFLSAHPGFKNAKLVSDGLVKISLDPHCNTVSIKDALDSRDVEFNFLDEYYFISQ